MSNDANLKVILCALNSKIAKDKLILKKNIDVGILLHQPFQNFVEVEAPFRNRTTIHFFRSKLNIVQYLD